VSVRILLTIAAASSAAACGAQGSGEAAHAAGLYGRVLIEPATPTCRPGVPCSKPAPGFELVFLRDGRRVAHATTDERGRYRIRLAPGRYVVEPEGRRPRLHPATAAVPSDRFAKHDFTYDAGIR
jgi:hypothetical protein